MPVTNGLTVRATDVKLPAWISVQITMRLFCVFFAFLCQVFVFFILTVAAAEAAIGLAILVVLFRNRNSINVDDIDTMKG